MKRFASIADVMAATGVELGLTDWVTLDQSRIDRFADATGDDNWVHIDPVRAAEGRYQGTIAHGFLTLSLIAAFSMSLLVIEEAPIAINYGLDRTRFPAPVPSGARVRAHGKLLSAEPLTDGVRLRIRYTMTTDHGTKPVCVAEHVSVRFTH